jgi:plastocyanin
MFAAAALCACSALLIDPAAAADITASVVDSTGQPVAGVVIIAQSDNPPPEKHVQHSAIMDQQHMQFVPRILVVQTGTGVEFPNSDQIQHQVYSFSPAKTFKLSLYAGHKYPPVIFDRPGLVTLGCNIHDGMIGYIYVTDSPFFGRSDSAGTLQLHGLPAGSYTLTAWHPQMQESGGNSLTTRVVLAEDSHATPAFRLSHPVRRDAPHSGDTRWADY